MPKSEMRSSSVGISTSRGYSENTSTGDMTEYSSSRRRALGQWILSLPITSPSLPQSSRRSSRPLGYPHDELAERIAKRVVLKQLDIRDLDDLRRS
jgi:hypothetical protein